MKPDQTRVGALLIDTVSLLCRNGLNFSTDIKVQGLLGITIDGTDVFLVHFNETFTENQPTASTEVQPATSDLAAVAAREDDPDHQNLMAAKPSFRKTGFPQLAGPRHRYGALPLSVQARRRARQLGTSMSQRMKVNSKPVEDDRAKCTERPPVAESDEKPDCSGYKSIKTEPDMEQFVQDVPEEQDDVILVESEDGALDQDTALPSDLDSGHAYLKTEERSEFSGDPMYSYNDSYEQFDPSSSELVHGAGGPGTFSSYGSNSGDVKPMNQMMTCAETWSAPQLDWNCTQNNQTIASKYGHMPVGPPHGLNHEDIEHMTMDAMSRFTVSMTTGNSRTFRHRVTQQTNATSQALAPRTGTSQQSLLPPQQQMPLDSWAANAGTMTSFVCKLCGATMGHRRSLLRHQINAHGRQKRKRGRPPIFPSL